MGSNSRFLQVGEFGFRAIRLAGPIAAPGAELPDGTETEPRQIPGLCPRYRVRREPEFPDLIRVRTAIVGFGAMLNL